MAFQEIFVVIGTLVAFGVGKVIAGHHGIGSELGHMIVGEGMRYAVGVAAKACAALADAGVNIEMINQGSSEISMMFGVREPSLETAVRALYHEFFESKP